MEPTKLGYKLGMKTKMPTSLLGYIEYLDPSSLFGSVPELKPLNQCGAGTVAKVPRLQ